MIRNSIICLFLFIGNFVIAQIHLQGIVIDAKTKEPLSYSNIIVSNIESYMTDDSGRFDLEVSSKSDSIIFTYLGYKDEVLKKKFFKKDTAFVVKLEPEGYMLQEFVVKAKRRVKEKDTIAIRIFRNVINHKDQNRPKAYDSYSYEEYIKTVASLYNVSPKLVDKKILKPFRFVIENQDSTENGNRFIPLILKETITEKYSQKEPKQDKTIIKASKVSGIEQLRFSELLDVVYDEVDVYDNQTIVNGSTFLLPFANGGLTLYNYYFVDSVKAADSLWVYQLAFVPKSKSDLLFVGRAWIQDSSFAIKKIDISIDKRANLNFVNDFMLKQSFTEIKNIGWFKAHEERSTNIAFTKRKKAKSVRIYRSLSRNDIQLNQPINDTIFKGVTTEEQPNFRRRSDEFWQTERHDSLSLPESRVYNLIDSLKNTKFYKRISKTGAFFSSGYYRFNKIDLGNLYQLLSWNDTEGARFRINLRSNWRLSNWISFNVYTAIGTKDKRVKYGANFHANLPDKKKKSHGIGVSYTDDYQRFSFGPGTLNYDYIYNSLLRVKNIPDLVYIRDVSANYHRTWFPNFNTNIALDYKKYKTIPGKIEFYKTLADSTIIHYNDFKIFTPQFTLFAAPGAKFLSTSRKNVFLKGKLPRFTFNYSFSIKGFLSDFTYHKLDVLIEERLSTPIGYSLLQLNASKLFGNAPYPLLFVHPGNQSIMSEYKRFTMMREAEFVGDQQLILLYEHHFDGFFFNKIPLWKKLGLREVFFTKMALSSLDKAKVTFSDLPTNLKGLNGYYAEIGFGIENIAKLIRVDFNWRLTQRYADTRRFRVTFSINPDF